MDPRHQRRIDHFQKLFAATFTDASLERERQDAQSPLATLLSQLPDIDQEISAAAPERPLKDINKIDLAILRLIMFESKQTKTPRRVLIDEAVELAKAFGSDTSSKFVNGVLARLLKSGD